MLQTENFYQYHVARGCGYESLILPSGELILLAELQVAYTQGNLSGIDTEHQSTGLH